MFTKSKHFEWNCLFEKIHFKFNKVIKPIFVEVVEIEEMFYLLTEFKCYLQLVLSNFYLFTTHFVLKLGSSRAHIW